MQPVTRRNKKKDKEEPQTPQKKMQQNTHI